MSFAQKQKRTGAIISRTRRLPGAPKWPKYNCVVQKTTKCTPSKSDWTWWKWKECIFARL